MNDLESEPSPASMRLSRSPLQHILRLRSAMIALLGGKRLAAWLSRTRYLPISDALEALRLPSRASSSVMSDGLPVKAAITTRSVCPAISRF